MDVVIVAGARPNFMKVAPIIAELKKRGDRAVLVHTGQHYDADMSGAFFDDLGMPAPDYHLGVGSGSHAVQTARVMMAIEPVLTEVRPDWLVVVGDVNSTLAAALVAAKLQPAIGVRIAHVEAGLRSGDWSMPEEVNRVITDRLSDLLLTPSDDGAINLEREGIDARRVVFVGNVMIDTMYAQLERARERAVADRLGFTAGNYAVATIHRPSNVDDPDQLREILLALQTIAQRMPVVIPMHPRTQRSVEAAGLTDLLDGLTVLTPLGYCDMLSLVDGAAVVLTDSGGLQEETTVLGVPCVTLRQNTERPVTVESGTNRLVPWPLTTAGVVEATDAALAAGRCPLGVKAPEGWDGHAAERIVDALYEYDEAVADRFGEIESESRLAAAAHRD